MNFDNVRQGDWELLYSRAQESIFIERASVSLWSSGFTYLGALGSGSYGNVFLVKDHGEERHAIKVVKPKNTSYGELHIWPELHHANILPLTNIIHLPSLPGIAFQMPHMPETFAERIENPLFYSDSNAIHQTAFFLSNILDGLSYLHHSNLAHLDLKSNNVLISNDGQAVLCDFTFLSKCDEPIASYGVPLRLRPPEACTSRGKHAPVDGQAFDSWTMGMLAMDALTRHVSLTLPLRPQDWAGVTYPALAEIFDESFFQHRVRWAFPANNFSDEDIRVIRSFVLMFLIYDPGYRPTMELAKRHLFLTCARNPNVVGPKPLLENNAPTNSEHIGLPARTKKRKHFSDCEERESPVKRFKMDLSYLPEPTLNVYSVGNSERAHNPYCAQQRSSEESKMDVSTSSPLRVLLVAEPKCTPHVKRRLLPAKKKTKGVRGFFRWRCKYLRKPKNAPYPQ